MGQTFYQKQGWYTGKIIKNEGSVWWYFRMKR